MRIYVKFLKLITLNKIFRVISAEDKHLMEMVDALIREKSFYFSQGDDLTLNFQRAYLSKK